MWGNGPGPTNVVIEDIVITYDSIFLPFDQVWFTYAVAADTIIGYECEPACQVGDSCYAYSLSVEAAPAVNPELGTTYRFYVNLENATDQVSAVYGNDLATFVVNAPEGVYNDNANSSWNASGINPAFSHSSLIWRLTPMQRLDLKALHQNQALTTLPILPWLRIRNNRSHRSF